MIRTPGERRYLKSFYRGNLLNFTLAIIAVLLSGAAEVLISLLLQLITDVATRGDMSMLSRMIVFSAVFLMLVLATSLMDRRFKHAFVRRAMLQYKDAAFSDITRKSISSFTSEATGSYISAFTNDAASIETNYLLGMLNIVKCFCLFVGALAMMFWYSWSLTLVVIGLCALPMLISLLSGGKLAQREKLVSERNEKFVGMVKDLLSGFTVIKSFQAEREALGQFSAQNAELENSKCARKRAESLIGILSNCVSFMVQIAVFAYGAYLAIRGEITTGVVIAFVQLMNYVLFPIQTLPSALANRKAARAMIKKMADYAENNLDAEGTVEIADAGDGIAFENVSFAYPGGPTVLHDVSAKFERGKSYAIVGASGSGKSTMLNLILGASGEYQGNVNIAGRELRDIKRESLYNVVSIIQQNVFIFDSTVSENISMFKDFDKAKIDDAAQRAGLKKLLEDKGADYLCGENGAHLSGGERQRVSIARCLLKNSSVMLMDEATAALDAETARNVTGAILSIDGLTRIIVTHKLDAPTLRRFDGIIALKGGAVIEQGYFDELIEKRGYFYSLYSVEA